MSLNLIFILSRFRYFVNIVVVILFLESIAASLLLIILLSGDVEVNPGPTHGRRRQCQMLYSNIRGLHRNLNELIVASKQFDILFCSETMVSNNRSPKELLIPGFKQPHLLKRNERERGQGMAAYIRNGFPASRKTCYECRCHEVLRPVYTRKQRATNSEQRANFSRFCVSVTRSPIPAKERLYLAVAKLFTVSRASNVYRAVTGLKSCSVDETRLCITE